MAGGLVAGVRRIRGAARPCGAPARGGRQCQRQKHRRDDGEHDDEDADGPDRRGAGQVDTRVIRLNTADVARAQTRATGVGGATLIDPIRF